jgi:hypothetical protein
MKKIIIDFKGRPDLPVWLIVNDTGRQSPELGELLNLFTTEEQAKNQMSYLPLAGKQVWVRRLATPGEVRLALEKFEQGGGVYVSINTRTSTHTEGRIYPVRELLDRIAS